MNKQILFLLLLFLSGAPQAALPTDELSAVMQKPAPEFISENLHGGNSALSDYKGKIILLNFWATWCMPCRAEMPGMESLWQRYKEQGLVVVAISVDEGSRERVEKFSEIFDLSFPILLDPESKVSDLYEVSNMPTSFLIDRNGKMISRIVGTEEWASVEAIQLVDNLLSK